MGCPRCGHETYERHSEGLVRCLGTIEVRDLADNTDRDYVVEACAHVYPRPLKGVPVVSGDVPECDCGTFAVGRCVECRRYVCEEHSQLRDGRRLCAEHLKELQRRETEQTARAATASTEPDLSIAGALDRLRSDEAERLAQLKAEETRRQEAALPLARQGEIVAQNLKRFLQAMAQHGHAGARDHWTGEYCWHRPHLLAKRTYGWKRNERKPGWPFLAKPHYATLHSPHEFTWIVLTIEGEFWQLIPPGREALINRWYPTDAHPGYLPAAQVDPLARSLPSGATLLTNAEAISRQIAAMSERHGLGLERN